MSHVVLQLRDALLADLASVDGLTGGVHVDLFYSPQEQRDYPLLSIAITEEAAESDTKDGDIEGVQEVVLTIVDRYAGRVRDGKALMTGLFTVAAAIERVLSRDNPQSQLAALALDIERTGRSYEIDDAESDPIIGALTLTYEVTYRYRAADPTRFY